MNAPINETFLRIYCAALTGATTRLHLRGSEEIVDFALGLANESLNVLDPESQGLHIERDS